MSKMAMSYVILAVCITFQIAQAGTLGDLTNSLPQDLSDKLYQGLKLVREGVNIGIKQSEKSMDRTIDELSHERDLTQKTRDLLLQDAQNANPCDKLTDTLKANTDLMYLSVYNCVLKGLVLTKSENTNITNVSNDLLDKLEKELPELTKCASESDLLSKLSCLVIKTTQDAISLAPSFEKLLALLPRYSTILSDTALCIGQSWPKNLLDQNLLYDVEQCARSYAQSLICDKKQNNLYMY